MSIMGEPPVHKPESGENGETVTPEGEPEAAALLKSVQAEWARNPEKRRILIRALSEGQKAREVAELVGVTPNALFRAASKWAQRYFANLVPREALLKGLQQLEKQGDAPVLTSFEKELAGILAQGKTVREAATILKKDPVALSSMLARRRGKRAFLLSAGFSEEITATPRHGAPKKLSHRGREQEGHKQNPKLAEVFHESHWDSILAQGEAALQGEHGARIRALLQQLVGTLKGEPSNLPLISVVTQGYQTPRYRGAPQEALEDMEAFGMMQTAVVNIEIPPETREKGIVLRGGLPLRTIQMGLASLINEELQKLRSSESSELSPVFIETPIKRIQFMVTENLSYEKKRAGSSGFFQHSMEFPPREQWPARS